MTAQEAGWAKGYEKNNSITRIQPGVARTQLQVNNEPPVQVQNGDGSVSYVPRAQATGRTAPGGDKGPEDTLASTYIAGAQQLHPNDPSAQLAQVNQSLMNPAATPTEKRALQRAQQQLLKLQPKANESPLQLAQRMVAQSQTGGK